jgi:plasmid stabilization system protein ParE
MLNDDNVRWNEFAEDEFKTAFDWYGNIDHSLSLRLVLCVDATLQIIKRHTFIGSPIYDDIRRSLIKNFPYGIYYRIEKKNIIVVGFRHFKQDKRKL